ncbi:hypothetical protein J2847_004143 [Azospirillum agricola]|uniref:hypothetical protein n=1 Tax=Azospirillum agricola TaxID=1720247 RepID=UPI001AE6ED01|nr:hypothetical protein [Azospirillum agricola]MBP2230834.1 hypothetical protein [Azospirillum agricola]
MSGVVKGVGKVFKKVASGASKILPVALAAGAVMFTAGNALGVTSSWGDAVKSVTDSLGAGSTLSNVLSGAITNAGYGAVAGAATSALSGGSAMQGAQYGAAAGAVLGGAKGAYDSYAGTSPTTAATEGGGGAATDARVDASPPASDAAQGGGGSLMRTNQPGSTATSAASPSNAATGAPSSTTSAAANPGVLDKGGWVERNGTLVGNTLTGLGKGLLAADGDAQVKVLQQRSEIVRNNYGAPRTGLLTASNAQQASAAQAPGMTPQQRFSQAGVMGQYVYDPATGRYTLVQQQATA